MKRITMLLKSSEVMGCSQSGFRGEGRVVSSLPPCLVRHGLRICRTGTSANRFQGVKLP